MKWPSESLRVQAYQMKKKNPTITDDEIYDEFVKAGKIVQGEKPKPNPSPRKSSHNTHTSASDDGVALKEDTPELPPDLLKIVQYTAQAQRICESWRPTDTISYLEKSKQLGNTQQEAYQSAQQLETSQLLAVIQPSESWQPGSLVLTTSSEPSISKTPSIDATTPSTPAK